jgi:hypothetical protein
MSLKKILIAGLLIPSMVTAASAANVAAVRPGVKPVSAAPLAARQNLAVSPAGEAVEAEEASQLFGLSAVAIIAAIVVVAAIVIVATDDDDEESPGS